MILKVVTAQEMARIEKKAIRAGCSEEAFMAEAGTKIASFAMEYLERHHLPKRVTLLVGKGNNGGDAYAAGLFLLEKGIEVRAWPLYAQKECSSLNQKFQKRFLKKGGEIKSSLTGEELILDGLLGTGFQGKIEEKIGEAIHQANHSGAPILAIDIPSGLDGTTGEVRDCAIVAKETIALGLAKSGFFLKEGWNHIGRLHIEDFGLPSFFIDAAKAVAHLPDRKQLQQFLPPLVRNRHKYQAGYVMGLAGSDRFRGAPKMAGLAALRAGAGIVQIFHNGELGAVPYELICQPWDSKKWREELRRAQAVFVGPGMGDTFQQLQREFKDLSLPSVFDAEALQPDVVFPKRAILTPHRGEALRLLELKKNTSEEELLAACQTFAQKKKRILLLKGAPTFIFASDQLPFIIPFGDPGMATAGSGDVLTGIVAALLAQGMKEWEAAILGASLHAIAGEEAAKEKTSYAFIATDLIDFLPRAFQRIQAVM